MQTSELRFVAVVLFGLFIRPGEAQADAPAKIAEIVASAGQYAIANEEVVGLSIGVARHDKVLCTQGFGQANVELEVPATAETVYRIGSITKQFTAAAILQLVDEGKMNLDDSLTKLLPKYSQEGHAVTVRNLLHHTSGVKDFTRLPNYPRELPNVVTQQEVLDRFQNLPLNFEPGQQFRYCNSGYFLLGVIVERVSGKSYQEHVQERLFNANNLQHTFCDNHARITPLRAAGYTRWGGVLRNARYVNLNQAIGAGNIASTVGDLLLWQQALISNQVLKPESTELMITQGKFNNGKTSPYAMGLFVRRQGDQQVIRHGGGISGFRSELAYYPASGYIIAVLANSENANAGRISDRIARRLLPITGKGTDVNQ